MILEILVDVLIGYASLTFLAAVLDNFLPAGKTPLDKERQQATIILKQKGYMK